jgi:hypothetical protein
LLGPRSFCVSLSFARSTEDCKCAGNFARACSSSSAASSGFPSRSLVSAKSRMSTLSGAGASISLRRF